MKQNVPQWVDRGGWNHRSHRWHFPSWRGLFLHRRSWGAQRLCCHKRNRLEPCWAAITQKSNIIPWTALLTWLPDEYTQHCLWKQSRSSLGDEGELPPVSVLPDVQPVPGWWQSMTTSMVPAGCSPGAYAWNGAALCDFYVAFRSIKLWTAHSLCADFPPELLR